MTIHPEQQRALAYLRRKGTEAPMTRLAEHVAGTFRELEELLDSLPAEARAASPGPGRWSCHEVVDHLVESHRPVVEQLGSLLEGRRPETPAIAASLQSPEPFARPWGDLVAELREIHRSILALLAGASDDLARAATAPVVMVVKVPGEDGPKPVAWEAELDGKAYAQAFRVHSLEHREQIRRTLAALGVTLPA